MGEIAFLLGDTPSSFYRAFARWTGQTPGTFRGGATRPRLAAPETAGHQE